MTDHEQAELCGRISDRFTPCPHPLPCPVHGPRDEHDEQERAWSKSEHLAEARAVEQHQEEKHGI